jgi:hypothetical protein
MANYFDITLPQGLGVAKLDGAGRAEVQYTVGNRSGIRREGRALLVSVPPGPAGPVEKGWVKPDPTPQRTFEPGQSQTFVIKIAVPPKSPEGSYTFRLDTSLVDRMDEGDTGPPVSFTVAKPAVPTSSFKWWIPVVAVVVVILIGVGVWLALPKKVGVPGLKGKTADQAGTALQSVGLTLDSTYGSKATQNPKDNGVVLEQDPSAGSQVSKGTSVKITLGSYKPKVAQENPGDPQNLQKPKQQHW